MSRVSRLRGPGGPELFDLPREAREVAPGAVHVPDWLSPQEQAELVAQCRGWSRGDHRMRHYTTSTGGVMSVQSTVLGRTWELPWAPTISSPERGAAAGEPKSPRPASGDRRAAAEGSTPDDEAAVGQRLPEALWHLGRRGVAAAYGEEAPEASSFEPTTALVNYYDASARMGQHQDLDEAGPEPIVSLSLGDSCIFRLGNTESRGRPHQDIVLRSGDLFVFGRQSRWAFHGVPAIRPGTGDPALGLRHGGRLNITIRSNVPGKPGRGPQVQRKRAMAADATGGDRR
ncbi:alpha-ketoglutarate-dependent dioxygenase AlkB [Kocuria sp. NBRC 114282]|uniref:alpha-ketoglutarate-dependent dioxygenase AlkB n=1 Tax=Kocuria sp. NBRC 114282 TaxID=2994520 RepID=UPI0033284EFD